MSAPGYVYELLNDATWTRHNPSCFLVGQKFVPQSVCPGVKDTECTDLSAACLGSSGGLSVAPSLADERRDPF